MEKQFAVISISLQVQGNVKAWHNAYRFDTLAEAQAYADEVYQNGMDSASVMTYSEYDQWLSED
jgi:hypothetical protein